jgi:hypothetical protein
MTFVKGCEEHVSSNYRSVMENDTYLRHWCNFNNRTTWNVWKSGGIAPHILTMSPVGNEYSPSCSGRLSHDKNHTVHTGEAGYIPRAGLKAVAKTDIAPLVRNRTPVVQPVATALYHTSKKHSSQSSAQFIFPLDKNNNNKKAVEWWLWKLRETISPMWKSINFIVEVLLNWNLHSHRSSEYRKYWRQKTEMQSIVYLRNRHRFAL